MDSSVASLVLRSYSGAYRPLQIEANEHHRGYSGANIFRVETPSGPFALRAWPAESLPAERIHGLHRLLAHLHREGVKVVPAPVASVNGSTLVRAEERLWQLDPWMPGTSDFHGAPSDARLIAAMHCLAGIHAAALSYRPQIDARDAEWFFVRSSAQSPAISERLDRLRGRNARAVARLGNAITQSPHDRFQDVAAEFLMDFDLAAPSVIRQLERMKEERFQLFPCLRDIWHDHVFFTGDLVSGVIDPSACRSDHPAVDLSRLIGSLIANDPHGWNVALDAYASRRPLTPVERQLVRALDASGVLLSGMTWIERRYLSHQTFAQSDRVLARLEHFLSRLKELNRLGDV